uniref:Uncharacterized protein n=1 Tax=Setaria viridis TaxID=4556 RepID=A0A4U6TK01_SETVI|nr:hypothetical protein SEVIR_9G511800v2 [Setaria viridis]
MLAMAIFCTVGWSTSSSQRIVGNIWWRLVDYLKDKVTILIYTTPSGSNYRSFDFFRFIDIIMHLDIHYILVHNKIMHLEKLKQPTFGTGEYQIKQQFPYILPVAVCVVPHYEKGVYLLHFDLWLQHKNKCAWYNNKKIVPASGCTY